MQKLIQQIVKFAGVGAAAFVIDYGCMVIFTELFGINYLISATLSFCISVVFNYFASMRFVFSHKDGLSKRREFIIFVVLAVIGLLLNNFCMYAGVELLGIHYMITKIGATVIVCVYNFISRKVFLDGGSQEQELPESEGGMVSSGSEGADR